MITDNEALNFIKIEKEILNEGVIDFPRQNQFLVLDAVTKNDPKIKFTVDINRKRAILSRCTFQQRVYTSIPLIRLDIDNKPHRNPDGEVLEGNHIHIYKEGYNLGWAYPLNHAIIHQLNANFDLSLFEDLTSHIDTFISFCSLCNITKMPLFQITSTI